MRLYVNEKEIPLLKDALGHAIAHTNKLRDASLLNNLLERVQLCEELQTNCRKSSGTLLNVNIETPFSDRE